MWARLSERKPSMTITVLGRIANAFEVEPRNWSHVLEAGDECLALLRSPAP